VLHCVSQQCCHVWASSPSLTVQVVTGLRSHPPSYAGLLITSVRAAEALVAAVVACDGGGAGASAGGEPDVVPTPSAVPVFALSRAAATLRASGAFVAVYGDGAANASELAAMALASTDTMTAPTVLPWLFVCGEARMDAIAAAFAASEVELREVPVYRMAPVPSAEVEATVATIVAEWSVACSATVDAPSSSPSLVTPVGTLVLCWFSPAGVTASLESATVRGLLARPPAGTRVVLAAIGETTAAAVRAAVVTAAGGGAGVAVHVCPTPNAAGFEAMLRAVIYGGGDGAPGAGT